MNLSQSLFAAGRTPGGDFLSAVGISEGKVGKFDVLWSSLNADLSQFEASIKLIQACACYLRNPRKIGSLEFINIIRSEPRSIAFFLVDDVPGMINEVDPSNLARESFRSQNENIPKSIS